MIKQDRGIVSLLTAIMVSILLIIMALGIVSILNSSGQQASDDELSARAFAAAEGGVEYAAQYLLNHQDANFNTCTSATPATDPNDIRSTNPNLYTFNYGVSSASGQNVITCLMVNNVQNQTKGSLGPNDANQVTLNPLNNGGGAKLQTIQVEWDPKDVITTQFGLNADGSLPDTSTAAAVELTIVRYHFKFPLAPLTKDSNVQTSTIKIANALVLPSFGVDARTANSRIFADCSGPGTQPCKATIDLNSATWRNLLGSGAPIGNGDTITVSVRSMYGSIPANTLGVGNVVPYTLTFFDSNNTVIPVPQEFSTIDVTARAGQVYRRLVVQAPIGRPAVFAHLNYVLFGDQEICKQFQIYKNASGNHLAAGAACGTLSEP